MFDQVSLSSNVIRAREAIISKLSELGQLQRGAPDSRSLKGSGLLGSRSAVRY